MASSEALLRFAASRADVRSAVERYKVPGTKYCVSWPEVLTVLDGRERLNVLYEHLEARSKEADLDMRAYHNCGTPCCVLGYASEVFEEITLEGENSLKFRGEWMYRTEVVGPFFGLEKMDARRVFGTYDRTWTEQLRVMEEVMVTYE